jgi:hypothetical protein
VTRKPDHKRIRGKALYAKVAYMRTYEKGTQITIVLQSLLVLYYAFSGSAKIAGAKYWADIFKNLGLPRWFRAGMLGRSHGLAWLEITMLLACLAHLSVKDPVSKTAPAIVFTLYRSAHSAVFFMDVSSCLFLFRKTRTYFLYR